MQIYGKTIKEWNSNKLEKQINILTQMKMFDPTESAELYSVLKNASIVTNDMTLGNLLARYKLDKNQELLKDKGHNIQTLKSMLQSEIKETREFAEDVINS
jgi:hypothetical protein